VRKRHEASLSSMWRVGCSATPDRGLPARAGRGHPARKEVRTFGIMASDMVGLADWLAGQGVTHVAIEPRPGLGRRFTIPAAGLHVLRINPAHVTDVQDLQWSADLLAYGLVQGQVTPLGSSRSAAYASAYAARRLAALFMTSWPSMEGGRLGAVWILSPHSRHCRERAVAATPGALPTSGGRALYVAATDPGTHA